MSVQCAASSSNLLTFPSGLSTCMSVPCSDLWQCLLQNAFLRCLLPCIFTVLCPEPPHRSTVTCVIVAKPWWLLGGMCLGVEFVKASIIWMHWERASPAELCLAGVEARALWHVRFVCNSGSCPSWKWSSLSQFESKLTGSAQEPTAVAAEVELLPTMLGWMGLFQLPPTPLISPLLALKRSAVPQSLLLHSTQLPSLENCFTLLCSIFIAQLLDPSSLCRKGLLGLLLFFPSLQCLLWDTAWKPLRNQSGNTWRGAQLKSGAA